TRRSGGPGTCRSFDGRSQGGGAAALPAPARPRRQVCREHRGRHLRGDRRLGGDGRRELAHQLTTGWAMITASFLPLAVLDVFRLLGARLSTALLAGLACSTLLLGIAGWEVGREGKLSTRERLVSAAVAAAFGGVMIVLKMLLH